MVHYIANGDRSVMTLRYCTIRLLAVAILLTCLFTGCKKKQGQSSSATDDSGQPAAAQLNSVDRTISPSTTADSSPKGKAMAPNVFFTGPGLYQSPNKYLRVEIKRKTPGYVTYTLWYSSEGNLTSPRTGMGPTYPLSEKELLMCWDDQGQLWTYHPIELVHYARAGDAELNRVFVGAGSKVRNQMPSAFRDALPSDINEIYNKAVAESPNGVLTIPLKRDLSSEQAD